MGTAIDPVLISRLSGEFETLGNQMWALGRGQDTMWDTHAGGAAAALGPRRAAGLRARPGGRAR
ncbi:hypothetical protein [Nocardia cyriacigeorgica]|uniref:hypothetical protein n=1 Tax=Nocardia cyriacigeorgica TaxID=135487 RepID=UPI00245884FC|nr:hypothetical protein [Nocardia cyriacigeorgica]